MRKLSKTKYAVPTSVRFTPETAQLIKDIAAHCKMSQTTVLQEVFREIRLLNIGERMPVDSWLYLPELFNGRNRRRRQRRQ